MILKKKHFHEVCGALHLHTTYSDGGTDYNELIRTASDLGLDFIVVTDHMSLEALNDGYEGFHKNLLVLVGYEHNDSNNLNHYLAIGVDRVFSECSKSRQYVEAVRSSGGIGFIAHPAEKRHYFGYFPPYPWTSWEVDGYDGIEIWNQMSDWVEQLKSWLSVIRILYPRRFIGSPPSELLQRWDRLNKKRFISGIGGVDAHSRKVRIGFFGFRIFPIKVELKGIRTHLYLKKSLNRYAFDSSKQSILYALKNGNGFISNYRHADARGTLIFIRYSNGVIACPGFSKNFSLPATILVEIPNRGSIRLIRDGELIAVVSGCHAEFPVHKKGIYRIEVYRKEKAWIYSNPFPLIAY